MTKDDNQQCLNVELYGLIGVGIKRVKSSWCFFIFARADFPRLPRKAARFALIFAVPHIPIMILRNRQPLICVSIAFFFSFPTCTVACYYQW